MKVIRFNKINLIMFAIGVFMLLMCAGAWAAAYEHRCTADVFRIALPGDWEEIPAEAIRDHAAAAGGELQNIMQLNKAFYMCGFQLRDTEQWFQEPYILISVNKPGKLSFKRLLTIVPVKTVKELNRSDHLHKIVTQLSFDELIYDRKDGTVWLKEKAGARGRQFVAISAILPTQSGYIQAAYISTEADTHNYEAVFEDIVNSIKVSDDEQYKTNWIEEMSVRLSNNRFMASTAFLCACMLIFRRRHIFKVK